MTLEIPPGFAEVIIPISHPLQSHVATVTFGIDVSGEGGVDSGTADNVMLQWANAMDAIFDSALTMGPVHLIVGQDGGDPESIEGTTTSLGASAHASPPPNVAVLIKKVTSTGGRRGRGRMFLPWALSASDIDEGGHIAGSTVVSISSAVFDLRSTLETESLPMVLLHSTGISAAPAPSPITGLFCVPLVATQRRRLGR